MEPEESSNLGSKLRGERQARSSRKLIIIASDQFLSAFTNFATVVVSARLLGPDGLGVVVLSLAVAFLALALERGAAGEPYLVLGKRTLVDGVTSSVLAVGLLVGILSGTASFLFSTGAARTTLLVAAATLPVLLFQDFSRFAFLAHGEPIKALLSDGAWAGAQGAAFILLWVSETDSPNLVLSGWSVGVFAGALASFFMLGPSLSLSRITSWVKESRGLSFWMTGQALLSQTSVHITLISVGAIAGFGSLGGLRATQAVLGPLTTALAVAPGFLLPSLSQLINAGRLDTFKRHLWLTALVSTSAAALYGATVIAGQTRLLPTVFGEEFKAFVPLMVPISLAALAQGIAVAPGLGSRAMRAGKAVFATQLTATSLGVPLIIGLSARYGGRGAAYGLLGQMILIALVAWVTFLINVRKRTSDVAHNQ